MRRLILALGAVSLLACGDSSGPSGSVEGTWDLATIDDEPLPYTIFQFGTSIRSEIMSHRVVAHSNGTYTSTVTIRDTENGTVTTTTETTTGTWTQTNAAVTITNSAGVSVTGAISGDALTYTDGGVVWVYHRD